MKADMLEFLRCPVSGSPLSLIIIDSPVDDQYRIRSGLLISQSHFFYPIIDFIPRLLIEAFIDYRDIIVKWMPDYELRAENIMEHYADLLKHVLMKNSRTKESFAFEWSRFNLMADRTWDANRMEMVDRFLTETNESPASLKGKFILDAGCGNGILDHELATLQARIVAMDFNPNIAAIAGEFRPDNLLFVQGDIDFPPFEKCLFDIVQASGVIVHVSEPRSTFQKLSQFVKRDGKLSVWVYHPRNSKLHKMLLRMRKFTSKWPLRLQYYLYKVSLLPVSFVIKRLKGNKQSVNEMMTDLLDHFTPEYRWEFKHPDIRDWFTEEGFTDVQITTHTTFGFNTVGRKKQ